MTRRERTASFCLAALIPPILAFTLIMTLVTPITAAEILRNGDLSAGAGSQPDSWRTEAWINDPQACDFHWGHPALGGPGELEVTNLKPDDARWMQSVSLGPGWYYLSAEIRTEDVGNENTGATISVMEDGIVSSDLKGTSPWTRVGFYLKVGASGADVEVALRLGGFASLNTGRAFFRNASVVAVANPPPGAAPVYDLEKIRTASVIPPRGSPASLVATFALLALVAAWGWHAFMAKPPRLSRAQARSEARRAGRR